MSIPRYPIVLFDWDGCLARTLPVWMDAYQRSLGRLGLFPDERTIAAGFGDWSGPQAFGIPPDQYAAWREDLLDTANAGLSTADLYDGARELLTQLRAASARTAVITSSTRENLEQMLDRTQVRPMFDVLVTHSDVARHKPDPEPLHQALGLLGGRVDEAVMVGDSDKDLAAAQRAGVDSLLLHGPDHRSFYHLQELRKHAPTYVCESFTEAAGVLLPQRHA